MGFAMASKSSSREEELRQYASKPVFGRRGDLQRGRRTRAGTTLSILAETISHLDLSIFTSTALPVATRWRHRRKRLASSAIIMRVAARPHFCLRQRQRRWIKLL